MARGSGPGYLSYTALVLLSACTTLTSATPGATAEHPFADLWVIDIDDSPAPPPWEGPPASAHAIRNRGVLPYQIIAIVASYLGTVIILGTVLLTVGRRARRRTLEMANHPEKRAQSRAVEMVKAPAHMYDPSPMVSPGSTSKSSWYSPRKLGRKRSAQGSVRSGISNPASPGMDSVVSFDPGVVEADKARRAEEMERLYAAVMAQDDSKSQKATASISDLGSLPATLPTSPGMSTEYGAQQHNLSRKTPLRLATDAPNLRHLKGDSINPASPCSPRSPIRAIYPPDSPAPPIPGSATSANWPTTPRTPSYFFQQSTPVSPHYQPQVRQSRTSSLGSTSSGGRKLPKGIRNLRISAPMRTGDDDNSDGARTPLSPRTYTDPGIPPDPPTARTLDSQYQPTTPGTARSWRYGEEQEEEELDEVRDLPLPNPQRPEATNSRSPGSSDLLFRQQAQQQAQQQQQSAPLGALPFRQQQFTQQQPYAPYANLPLSGGPTKTTFVETRQRGRGGGPRSGGQLSALATPYSPYMPFTPLTPVTPRLTSRAERKARQKEERTIMGALTEEDQVKDDGDVWGNGY